MEEAGSAAPPVQDGEVTWPRQEGKGPLQRGFLQMWGSGHGREGAEISRIPKSLSPKGCNPAVEKLLDLLSPAADSSTKEPD